MAESGCWSREAIRPNSVCIPVATTIPFARPYVAKVPLNAIFVHSPRGKSASARTPVIFSTGRDSPVRAASSVRKENVSTSRISAGTRFPASRRTISPGTRASEGTVRTAPSRRTVAMDADIFFKASIAASARRSCTKPSTALSPTMSKMTRVSVRSPTRPDTRAATSRTSTMKSANCFKKTCRALCLGAACSWLGPYWRRRPETCILLKPRLSDSKERYVSPMETWCGFVPVLMRGSIVDQLQRACAEYRHAVKQPGFLVPDSR